MRQYVSRFAFIALCVLLMTAPFGAGISSGESTMPYRLQSGRPEDVGMSGEILHKALDVIERAVTEGDIPGAEVMIVRHGVVVAHEAYGDAVRYPTRHIMTKNTLFDIASITKLFTATATMMLLERGQLRLDDTVGQFLPHPEFVHGEKKNMSLRHLLTHTSGLPSWIAAYRDGEGKAHYIRTIAETKLNNAPGEAYAYSDLGFILLGFIVEAVSGHTLDEFLYENVFAPLGMTHTMFRPKERWQSTIAATEWDTTWRNKVLIGEVHDENAAALGGVAGHAGLFSTAYDLAVFGHMLLNFGTVNASTVLSPSSVLLMTQNHTIGTDARRGLGFELRPLGKASINSVVAPIAYGHDGFTGTSLWIDPVEQLVVVVLTNGIHPQRDGNKAGNLRRIVHQLVVDSVR